MELRFSACYWVRILRHRPYFTAPICTEKCQESFEALPESGTFAPHNALARPPGAAIQPEICAKLRPLPYPGSPGRGPPLVTRTAQYLNSGILPNGSSFGLVSAFAAAS